MTDKVRQYPWSNCENVRACPFCGKNDMQKLDYNTTSDEPLTAFGCVCGFSTNPFKTIEEAIEAWNQRASDAEIEKLKAELALAEGALRLACDRYFKFKECPDKQCNRIACGTPECREKRIAYAKKQAEGGK